jgi:Flp pilus assembly protein TadG
MKLPTSLRILCKANHGAALVELALLLPVLMLLVVGAIDFGRAYFVYLEVVSAAHAGAEYGSLHPTDTTGMSTAATQSAPNVSNLTVPTAVYGCECSDGSSYTASCSTVPTCTASAGPPARASNVVYRVQVKTQAVYTPLMPWTGIPSSFTFSNTATIRGNYP